MGCGDACPVIPGKRYVDWELQDPAGRTLETVRAIRDEIERRVAELCRSSYPAEMSATPASVSTIPASCDRATRSRSTSAREHRPSRSDRATPERT